MTGYFSSKFRHECESKGCYVLSLPNWDELIECFPRKIRPTDVDGFVEIQGRFLFLEEKRAGVGPDEGQRRALKRLADLPGVTVLFFRPGDDTDYEVLIFDGSPARGWRGCTRHQLLAWLTNWAERADQASSAS